MSLSGEGKGKEEICFPGLVELLALRCHSFRTKKHVKAQRFIQEVGQSRVCTGVCMMAHTGYVDSDSAEINTSGMCGAHLDFFLQYYCPDL